MQWNHWNTNNQSSSYMNIYTNYIYFHPECNKFIEKLTILIKINKVNTKCIYIFHPKCNNIVGTLTNNHQTI